MAEAVLNRLGDGGFQGFSAGSHPTGAVNPLALELLAAQGYPTGALRSKSWDEFSGPDAPRMDFIFTVCDNAAGEACPVWPGQPVSAHWGLPDPAAVQGTPAEQRLAFADTLRMLNRRIGCFVNLPFDSLDTLSLRNKLNEIGQIQAVSKES